MQPLTEPPVGPASHQVPPGHQAVHVVPVRVYLAVFTALAVLTVITVVVTGFDFGPFNLIVALGVAITKTSLVVLYFMHARYSPRLTSVVIAAAIGFFIILVFLTWTDYWSRPWPTS